MQTLACHCLCVNKALLAQAALSVLFPWGPAPDSGPSKSHRTPLMFSDLNAPTLAYPLDLLLGQTNNPFSLPPQKKITRKSGISKQILNHKN